MRFRGREINEVPWIWVLIGWTLFLWLSRLRNVLINDDLSSGGRLIRVAVVIIFVALAMLVAVSVRKQRPQILVVFLVWTVGYWLVRGIGILADGDYSARFKAVHTVLMLVSLGLSGLTLLSPAARQLGLRR